jgi:hypothetical protein
VTEPVEGEVLGTGEVEVRRPVPEITDSEEMPELVRQLLTDALVVALPGQTVRFTADDRDQGRRKTWSVIKGVPQSTVDEKRRKLVERLAAEESGTAPYVSTADWARERLAEDLTESLEQMRRGEGTVLVPRPEDPVRVCEGCQAEKVAAGYTDDVQRSYRQELVDGIRKELGEE